MMNLRVGDTVEVKSCEEILSTLDSKGTLEALPFMPEMLKYCGKQYKVYKRADKTSHYITLPDYRSRRMYRTVHLEGLRCDGEYHDACDALCLLYWKEVWLKKIDGKALGLIRGREEKAIGSYRSQISDQAACKFDTLLSSTKIPMDEVGQGKEKYSCQITEVLKASSELGKWDLRQYYRDLASGNIGVRDFAKWSSLRILNRAYYEIHGHKLYPFLDERLVQRSKTPHETLNLQVGDYVQIKSLKEIYQTLDVNFKNRGLLFAPELVPYCGKISKVIKIVKRIVNEIDGNMLNFTNSSVILEGVVCTGYISRKRLFCPKSCYLYWREIWLKKMKQ
jgi:hypothetical protein